MTPEAITLLLKEATEAFTVIEGKPSDDDIRHLRNPPSSPHGYPLRPSRRNPFSHRSHHRDCNLQSRPWQRRVRETYPPPTLGFYYSGQRYYSPEGEARNSSQSPRHNYASYEAAERGLARFLREVVDDLWINDLKNADTF